MRGAVTILAMLAMAGPAAAETIQLYAAGSLKAALTDVSKHYEAKSGQSVEGKFGPSGLLKDEITRGAKADLFASANMDHPPALHNANQSSPVLLFARNKLCAPVKPGLKVESANLLEHMLAPQVRLGTSTPNADPSGDYAFEVLRKAEAIKPGARATLENKALRLTGNANSAAPPAGRALCGWHAVEGRADIFLTYCTNALAAQNENPGQQIVALPDDQPQRGSSLISFCPPKAKRF